ncbi:ABC transporter substrate-binding protein [Nonomuraea sp. NPDC050153]|uniref:ABC transporter substrate-binding protein n=1 Tax=Nonomuraea sp. NPDC050153 TaxID=3364359 RepID=UPI0037BDEB39
MHRNTFLVPAALALSATVLTACGGGDGATSAQSNSLTFVSYGSAFQENQKKAWQAPYTAATGTTFRNDGPTDEAKTKTMVEAGKVTWDVVDSGAAFAAQNCGKYLEKLDLSQFDTSKFPAGTVTDCGVPAYFYGLHFLYNTKKYGANPPTTIADFFDTAKFPGQRMLPPEVAAGILEDALLADGLPADKLYPLDVDRALKKLDAIKASATLAKTYGQMQQAMVDDQVDMVLTVTARATSSLNAGATFKPVWDKTILTWDSLVIPKGTPHKDAAMKFIAFTAKPEQSAKFTELANVLPSNSDAKPTLTAAQQQLDPNLDDRKSGTVLSDVKWWSENLDAVTKKYTAWQAG